MSNTATIVLMVLFVGSRVDDPEDCAREEELALDIDI